MTQRRFWALLYNINRELALAQSTGQKEPTVRLKQHTVAGYLPHFWKTEARSPEEWFIRYCRGIGLHATLLDTNQYVVRFTRDDGDEASITWPGKVVTLG